MADQINVDEVTPDQVFEQMPSFFHAEKAGATNAVINFELSGEGGGQWNVTVADGAATAAKGLAENPQLTLLADARDYVKIAFGKLDPTAAFMQGKLKIKGDMGLALKFGQMFKRPT